MPRIPNYEAAGTSVPRTNTPRFNQDRSTAIVAEGQEALLGAVGQVVDQAVDHDDKLRYAAARSTLLQEQAALRKEFETDTKYDTYEKRFNERMAKARSSAAANIRGARSRELFEADAQADIERGLEQVRGLARAREVDDDIATVNANLEANRTAALESKDPIERGALVQSSLDLIDGAVQRNSLSKADGVRIRDKYKADYAEAFVGIQTPAERITLLESPETNVAKFIAPDRRKALLEAAKKDNDEVRVRGESQAVFDALMAKHGTNFRAAFNEARDQLKDDPLLRDATESRISQEQVRVETFEREDAEDAGEQALQFLVDGGKFADLDPGLKKRLKPATLNSLKNFAQSGGRTVSDPATLVELSQLASDPQNFADKVEMMRYRPLLTDRDFQQYVDLQRKIRTGSVDGKASGFLSINQVRDVKLKEFFGASSSKNKETQAQINDFVSKFEAAQRASREQNGGKVTSEDARKILDQLWSEVVISEGYFGTDIGGTKKRAYELTEQDVDVPATDRNEIITELRRRGKPVTAQAIRDWYLKAAGPSTTKKSISEVIDEVRESEARKKVPAP